MTFFADLHLHTKYSHCSLIEPADVLKRTRHLDKIAVTDHTTFKGYEAVKKLNKRRDFEIIQSAEFFSEEGDVVGYYVNELIRKGTPVLEMIDNIKEQGGIVSIPHPFDIVRSSAVRDEIKKFYKKIDLIEGLNGRTFYYYNNKAKDFAKKHHIPAIATTDSHFAFELGRVYAEFNGKITKPLRFFDDRIPMQWVYFEILSKAVKIFK